MTQYHIEKDNQQSVLLEAMLRKKLRENEFSGLEMIRREDWPDWRPLHDTDIFREEVPMQGSAKDTARLRHMRGFTSHAGIFIAVAAFCTFFLGFQWWLGVWGVFVALHGLKMLPVAKQLHNEGKLFTGMAGDARRTLDEQTEGAVSKVLGGEGAEQWTLPERQVEAFEGDADSVREMLSRRGDESAKAMLPLVDAIVESIRQCRDQEENLEAQTNDDARREAEETLAEARQIYEESSTESDRRLFRRQVETLESRVASLEGASRALRRLHVKRRTAEQQLKQLRLDLSRAEATQSDLGQISARLEDIRVDIEAQTEVEEIVTETVSR